MNRRCRRVARLEKRLGLDKGGRGPCAECHSGRNPGPPIEYREGEPIPRCLCPACGRDLEPATVTRHRTNPVTGKPQALISFGWDRSKKRTPRRAG